jgi:hypothetical protein
MSRVPGGSRTYLPARPGTTFEANGPLRIHAGRVRPRDRSRDRTALPSRQLRRAITRRARITDVGSTSVERPEWYAAAVEATGEDG